MDRTDPATEMTDGAAPSVSVLLAASEVVGFAKTGGLADVAGSLPPALARRGHACAVMLPLYKCVRDGKTRIEATDHILPVPFGGQTIPARLYRSALPGTDVPVYLVEHAGFYERDDPPAGRGLYHTTTAYGQRRDYDDNCLRFAFFCRAVLEAVPALGLKPDVIHANDWQTGLLPVFLRELYRRRPGFGHTGSLFTIHNIAYQGTFRYQDFVHTGLDPRLFNHRQLEFYGQLNCLKAGIVFADRVNTVSPTYAREIQTTYFGNGLDGVLTERGDRLSGIVNGVDYAAWDPATDPNIAANYTPETVTEGKPVCKEALQKQFNLPVDPAAPLVGIVARLAEQKGIDLVLRSSELLLHQGVQLVVLGEGDPDYHLMLRALQQRHPVKVGLALSFNERLAHQIEAGADLFLMPSQYEPSGLNQLYSLKYGTVPVVRATGGLADTIVDTTDQSLADGTATGFRFVAYTPQALVGAVKRALDLYHNRPETWLWLVRNGMRQDWSWDRSAKAYEELYLKLLAEKDPKFLQRAARPAAGR